LLCGSRMHLGRERLPEKRKEAGHYSGLFTTTLKF
jgi:hypothetical protein